MTWFGYIDVLFFVLLIVGLINGAKDNLTNKNRNAFVLVVVCAILLGTLVVGTGHLR